MSHRRRLMRVDDPLDASPARALRPTPELRALYVRLPVQEFDDLARAAFELNEHKRDLVTALVRTYIDPNTPDGLAAVRALLANDAHRAIGRSSDMSGADDPDEA